MIMDKKKLNVLVTGGNGQLGCALRAAAKGSSDRYVFTDISTLPGEETVYLDVTNPAAVEIVCDSEKVDVIINCASYTDVEGAEGDPGTAALLNGEVARTLASVCRSRRATLIHISTDYIFSGQASEPIREDAAPAPANVYGASKLAGEKAIADSACSAIIIRTAWMFSQYGRNFVKTMLGLTRDREQIRVVSDQVGTPTFADDLAAFIVDIISSRRLGEKGTYNYTNLGVTSWYDFATAIRDLSGNSCEITPCHSSEYPQKARRPHYSVLDKTLVQKTFGISIPHWYESLKKCIAQIDGN